MFVKSKIIEGYIFKAVESKSFVISGSFSKGGKHMRWEVEVWYKAGVTDAVGDSVIKGIKDLGVGGVTSVKTGQVYIIEGKTDKKQIEKICSGLLANGIVQFYKIKKV